MQHFYTHSEMVGRVREWRPHLSYVERVLDRSQRSFRSFNYVNGSNRSLNRRNLQLKQQLGLCSSARKTSVPAKQPARTARSINRLKQNPLLLLLTFHYYYKKFSNTYSTPVFQVFLLHLQWIDKKGKLWYFLRWEKGSYQMCNKMIDWERNLFLKVVCNVEALPFL